jgi:hypothetical protein
LIFLGIVRNTKFTLYGEYAELFNVTAGSKKGKAIPVTGREGP